MEPESTSVLGIVVDHGSGEPIAGAEVLMGAFEVIRAVTDHEGLFELPLDGGAMWHVRARASGYFASDQPLSWEDASAQREGRVVIELMPSGRISGRVMTTAGEPVRSGRVYVFPAGSPQTSWMVARGGKLREDPWSESFAAAMGGARPLDSDLALASFSELDAEGHFELASLPELPTTSGAPRPSYDLAVRSNEVVLTCMPGVEVGPGDERNVEIQAEPASRIVGRILLPSGTDSSKSQVWFCWHARHLERAPSNGRGWLGKDRVVSVDDAGRFDSGPLWAAEHVRIRAMLPLKDVNSSAPAYTWDLALEEATLKTVELAPGDDVRYIIQ